MKSSVFLSKKDSVSIRFEPARAEEAERGRDELSSSLGRCQDEL